MPIAKALGMPCTEYPRTAREYPFEETVWAACGWPGTLNWTLFDYPEPLCLFFTGCHGETMWDRVTHDHPDPFVRRDVSSLGFCEFRLIRGVWQCPVPFWGVRHSHELKAITLSDEMRPWYTGKDYDKPIARRIVEQAGVPRGAFGKIKRMSVLATSVLCPYSPEAHERFHRYLKERSVFTPPQWLVWLIRYVAHIETLLYSNVTKRIGIRKRPRPWNKLGAACLLFQWANEELKHTYVEGLRDVQTQTPSGAHHE